MKETNLLFVYGILKRGFSLDLSLDKGCKFIGEAQLPGASLHAIGMGVGMRLHTTNTAHGEVFEIPERLWKWLDGIEGVAHGVYARTLVKPAVTIEHAGHKEIETVDAFAYEHVMWPSERYNAGNLIESGLYVGGY